MDRVAERTGNMGSNGAYSNLACRIGLNRIAMMVDVFYNQVRTHPTLSVPFGVVGNWSDHKVRLTYFWWSALGGTQMREADFEAVPQQWTTDFDGQLMQDWIVLFRRVVYSTIEKELADAWMERAEELGGAVLFPNVGWTLADSDCGNGSDDLKGREAFQFAGSEASWMDRKGLFSAGRAGQESAA